MIVLARLSPRVGTAKRGPAALPTAQGNETSRLKAAERSGPPL